MKLNMSSTYFRTSSTFLHDPRFAHLQYAWSLDSQVCRGLPTRRVPKGCHDSKRWTHRCAGKAATCLARFQWCLHVMYDHVLTCAFAIKSLTRSFHKSTISFQAAFCFARTAMHGFMVDNEVTTALTKLFVFCLAPARIKLKHYVPDPIGTGEKSRSKGPRRRKPRYLGFFGNGFPNTKKNWTRKTADQLEHISTSSFCGATQYRG